MQVRAGNVTPVSAMVQNLIMTALFEPFEALCSAANGELAEVWLAASLLDDAGLLLYCSVRYTYLANTFVVCWQVLSFGLDWTQ